MTRQYSIKSFFRKMPKHFLALYFEQKQLFSHLDFSKMKEVAHEELFLAWETLPDEQQYTLEAEFRALFEMSCKKGNQIIIDTARFLLSESECTQFVETLSTLRNHYERIMYTFLNQPKVWQQARRLQHVDNLSSHWHLHMNIPHTHAATDEKSLQQLSNAIRDYFHKTEGRGNNCFVEYFRLGDLDCFLAYPEDHSQHDLDWVDGQLNPRPHNPPFEIVYVYCQKRGKLDLNFYGSNKTITALQSFFATYILKLETLPPNPKDERTYDLNPFLQGAPVFRYEPDSGIEDVWVKKIRLTSRIDGREITLKSGTSRDPEDIYGLIDTFGQGQFNLYDVTQVELTASMVLAPGERPKKVPIRLTHPNLCNLQYDDRDLTLRKMLEDSGIELKDAEPETPLLTEEKELSVA